MLLSPAGLGASPTASTSTSTSHAHTLSGLDRRMLNVPTRPPIKRTASTSSVNEIGELNLPPSMQGKVRRKGYRTSDDSDSISSDMEHDDKDDIGTFEDWVPETGEEQEDEEDDPFSVPTSKGGRNDSSRNASSTMLMASPGSSPTPALAHSNSKLLAGSGSSRMALDSDDEGRDDVDNNPFLANNNGGPPRAPRKRAGESKPKVSYVFRGKRITYDAPLESIFPATDSDEEALPGMLSGPRVLFPAPATPSAAPSSKLPNVSPPVGAQSASIRNIELMQTPRRQTASSAATPAKAGHQAETTGKGRQREEPEQRRVIPPTPASLPQKSREQVQLERERFQSAMRGLQHGTSASSRHARRAAPYPPR